MNAISYLMDKKELVFLAALMGENMIIGVDDPFTGWLAEQVKDEWTMRCPQMIVKGYLTVNNQGEVVISNNIQSMVQLCCSPDIWVALNDFEKTENNSITVIYFDRVKQTMAILKSNTQQEIINIDISEWQQIGDQIIRELNIDQQIENRRESFEISDEVFKKAIQTNKKVSASVTNNQSPRFFAALERAKTKSAITYSSSWPDNQAIKSLVIVADKNSLWRVEINAQSANELIRVVECDVVELTQTLNKQIM